LIQAYGETAKQVIEHANSSETEILKTVTFSYDFDFVPVVRNLLNKYDAKVIEEKCDKEIICKISINSGY